MFFEKLYNSNGWRKREASANPPCENVSYTTYLLVSVIFEKDIVNLILKNWRLKRSTQALGQGSLVIIEELPFDLYTRYNRRNQL